MNPLVDKLRDLIETGVPVGFCPWMDGDGMLWGRILNVTETTFRVQHLDIFGREEEVEEYEFSSTVYFDIDPIYAERLKLLQNFTPTLDEEGDPVDDENEIAEIFSKAFKSGEVIRISTPGDTDLDVTVGEIGFGWAEVTYYNDLMTPKGSQWLRIDQVDEVSWRNSRCEADGYLLKLRIPHDLVD